MPEMRRVPLVISAEIHEKIKQISRVLDRSVLSTLRLMLNRQTKTMMIELNERKREGKDSYGE